ncbi:MAG: GIY-YIG nuclease family protein [Chloroflexota bacterium]|nr:MAG: GIY-YIG nuclease family protein [Chloroflexota bacterium]
MKNFREINTSGIPSQMGSYALHLRLDQPSCEQIGRLGEFYFPAGDYLYIGSAMGSGGLRARLSHHLRGPKRNHWHIDWLRAITKVAGFYYLVGDKRFECLWSQMLGENPGTAIPAPRFGASDCMVSGQSCFAHLFWLGSGLRIDKLAKLLSEACGTRVPYLQVRADTYHEIE